MIHVLPLVLPFLSTPSARRATKTVRGGSSYDGHFYPRPPRGGRLALLRPASQTFLISIHALREEGDKILLGLLFEVEPFLSTPSARRATPHLRGLRGRDGISIHALREEGDLCGSFPQNRCVSISIHALREEGDPDVPDDEDDVSHISIHALREEGDPAFTLMPGPPKCISIHALREEGDL